MGNLKPLKVILFDIGGVCVLSPLQAIQDFERANNLPPNWLNFAIRHASPDGHWQRLERGEIKLDADFFKGFKADLESLDAWKAYKAATKSSKASLKDLANRTQLGDHVSLKAETTATDPTRVDKSNLYPYPKSDNSAASARTTKHAADTTIGDPVSLEAEDVVDSDSTQPGSSSSSTSSSNPPTKGTTSPDASHPPPINAETLFWTMLSASRHPDPYIFPALQRLLAQSPPARPIIAALSNTVIFPPDHPWSISRPTTSDTTKNGNGPTDRTFPAFLRDPQSFFDVYVASAAVGQRKPARGVYELTMRRLNEHVTAAAERANGGTIEPADVLFLEDIGENLKTAREVGMRTVKVQPGKTWRAVKVLEEELGGEISLMDERTRRANL